MLHFNFTRLFRARGINTPSKFLVQHGFSDKFATRVVRNDFRKLNIDDVEKLCEIFLCTPNDLLQWTPDSKTSDPSTHPLAPLMRDEKVMDLTRTLNSVPFERLLEIEKLIQEEVNKD
jgi:DNA-binding Xre family transcriptional regulator